MNEESIKKSWRNLLIPFLIGLTVFTISLVLNQFGSKRPTPQTLSLFGCVLGLVFMFFPGIKMLKFKKYLKEKEKRD
jgi:fucose 4-O-acetylase-like acetyltransferase